MESSKFNGSGERRVYRVDEAAIAFRLSRSTLYKLMAAGTLRSVKLGGRRLIPVEAFEALRTASKTTESVLVFVGVWDFWGGGIPKFALAHYAFGHDRRTSDSPPLDRRRLEAR
jgi:excisionase family DNA binding protein